MSDPTGKFRVEFVEKGVTEGRTEFDAPGGKGRKGQGQE